MKYTSKDLKCCCNFHFVLKRETLSTKLLSATGVRECIGHLMIEYIVIAKSCDVIGTSIVQGKDFLKEISFQEEANATKSFFLSFFIGRFGPLTTN